MPPPYWTSTPAAARIRSINGKFTGEPLFAPSRSTTCSHSRTELAVLPGQRHRVHGVARLLLEVAFEKTHAAAVAKVDGGDQPHMKQLVRVSIFRKLWSIWAPSRDERSG